jgi:hypothetical protein
VFGSSSGTEKTPPAANGRPSVWATTALGTGKFAE